MNPKIRRITETAAMVALLVALQAATAPAGQYVTGSCVNAVLAVTTLVVGVWSGVVVALVSPFFAFLLGIGPQLPPVVPAIAVGNLVFILLLWDLAGRAGTPVWRQAVGLVAAAAGKFLALFLIVVQLLCRILTLPQPQVEKFTAMFSYPQLLTALIGGALALLIAPVLRKALKR